MRYRYESYDLLGLGVYLGYITGSGWSLRHVLYGIPIALAVVAGWALLDGAAYLYERRQGGDGNKEPASPREAGDTQ